MGFVWVRPYPCPNETQSRTKAQGGRGRNRRRSPLIPWLPPLRYPFPSPIFSRAGRRVKSDGAHLARSDFVGRCGGGVSLPSGLGRRRRRRVPLFPAAPIPSRRARWRRGPASWPPSTRCTATSSVRRRRHLHLARPLLRSDFIRRCGSGGVGGGSLSPSLGRRHPLSSRGGRRRWRRRFNLCRPSEGSSAFHEAAGAAKSLTKT